MRKRALSFAALLTFILGLVPTLAGASVTMDPASAELTMRVGESQSIEKTVTIPASPALPVDVFFLVDTTGSFGGSLPVFKTATNAPGGIIDTLVASGLDVQIGAADFRDYPIAPYGGDIDYAYMRHTAITSDITAAKAAIDGISLGWGYDFPESQLPALYQAATGAGQDLSGAGYPAASIPAGQQAGFRSGAVKLIVLWTDAPFHRSGDTGGPIPYPGPSMADTLTALNAEGIKVAGVLAGGSGAALADLNEVALGTNTLAPNGGVDCDNNGTIDVPTGAPLVCPINASGAGIADAILALVDAVANTADVSLQAVSDPLGQFVGATPAVYADVDLKVENVLHFTETFTCPAGSENTSTVVTIGLYANGGLLAEQHVTINCLPEEIEVPIDVKPNSDPSSFGCRSRGNIPVALLSTDSFDATAVNANSIRFGKTGTEASPTHVDRDGNVRLHMEDVNGDGLMDLVFQFAFTETGFTCADIPAGETAAYLDAILTGEMPDGTPIVGHDLLRLVSGN